MLSVVSRRRGTATDGLSLVSGHYTCRMDRLDHLVIALDIASHHAVERRTNVARSVLGRVVRQHVSKMQVACVHKILGLFQILTTQLRVQVLKVLTQNTLQVPALGKDYLISTVTVTACKFAFAE